MPTTNPNTHTHRTHTHIYIYICRERERERDRERIHTDNTHREYTQIMLAGLQTTNPKHREHIQSEHTHTAMAQRTHTHTHTEYAQDFKQLAPTHTDNVPR